MVLEGNKKLEINLGYLSKLNNIYRIFVQLKLQKKKSEMFLLLKKKQKSVINLVDSSPLFFKMVALLTETWYYKWFGSDLSFPKTFPINENKIYLFAIQPWYLEFGIIVVSWVEKIEKDKQLRNSKFREDNNHFLPEREKNTSENTGSGAYVQINKMGQKKWSRLNIQMCHHAKICSVTQKEVRNKNSYSFCIFHYV